MSRFGPAGVGCFGPVSKVGRFGPILGVSRFGLINLFGMTGKILGGVQLDFVLLKLFPFSKIPPFNNLVNFYTSKLIKKQCSLYILKLGTKRTCDTAIITNWHSRR